MKNACLRYLNSPLLHVAHHIKCFFSIVFLLSSIKQHYWYAAVLYTTYCNVPELALFSVSLKLKKVWAVIRNDKFRADLIRFTESPFSVFQGAQILLT